MPYFNFKVPRIIAGDDSPIFSIVFRSAFGQGSKLSYISRARGDGSIEAVLNVIRSLNRWRPAQ